jgi:hypothetical protein
VGLDALIAVQCGVVRRGQLLRAGLAPATIRDRLRSGQWQIVFPAVYALFPGSLDAQGRLVSGWLYAGRGAQIAGPSALRLYGLRNGPADSRVHLLIPHQRQVRSSGFVAIHRTIRMDLCPRRVESLTACSPVRALADTARWHPDSNAIQALVSEAVEQRLATVDELRRAAVAGRRNGSGLLCHTLDEIGGGRTRASGQGLRTTLLQSRELPGIVWNPRLAGPDGQLLPDVDGWLDEAGIGLAVVPAAADTSIDNWEYSQRRQDAFAEHGVLVLEFPAARLRRDPSGVRAEVVRAYRQRLAHGARGQATMVRG